MAHKEKISLHRLDELLDQFPDLHILVIGDFFLDKYLIIDRKLSEISLETGLQAHQIIEIHYSPGAAGTVVSNLRALGVKVSALGVIGTDGNGYELKRTLKEKEVNIDNLIEEENRFTPAYTKPIIREENGLEHEIERMDIKNRSQLPRYTEDLLIKHLKNAIHRIDGVIIADQVQEPNCGVITDRVRKEIDDLALHHPDVIFIADSRTRIDLFQYVIIKPNAHEALLATHRHEPKKIDIDLIKKCGDELFRKNQKPVFITAASEGVLVFTQSGCRHISGISVDGSIDIVGAGDSAMAGIASALCSGAEPWEAGFVANLIASITIQQIGMTGTASREQIRQQFKKVNNQ